MKLIMAIIQPARLAPVRQALADVDVTAMTVSEVRGFGQQGGITTTYRGAEYHVDYIDKLKGTLMNVRFGSKAATQKPKNCRMAEFGTEDAFVSVRFRPKADIASNSPV